MMKVVNADKNISSMYIHNNNTKDIRTWLFDTNTLILDGVPHYIRGTYIPDMLLYSKIGHYIIKINNSVALILNEAVYKILAKELSYEF